MVWSVLGGEQYNLNNNMDIDLVASWIMKHAVHLTKGGDSLLFRLHELQYLELVRNRKIVQAMEYAK